MTTTIAIESDYKDYNKSLFESFGFEEYDESEEVVTLADAIVEDENLSVRDVVKHPAFKNIEQENFKSEYFSKTVFWWYVVLSILLSGGLTLYLSDDTNKDGQFSYLASYFDKELSDSPKVSGALERTSKFSGYTPLHLYIEGEDFYKKLIPKERAKKRPFEAVSTFAVAPTVGALLVGALSVAWLVFCRLILRFFGYRSYKGVSLDVLKSYVVANGLSETHSPLRRAKYLKYIEENEPEHKENVVSNYLYLMAFLFFPAMLRGVERCLETTDISKWLEFTDRVFKSYENFDWSKGYEPVVNAVATASIELWDFITAFSYSLVFDYRNFTDLISLYDHPDWGFFSLFAYPGGLVLAFLFVSFVWIFSTEKAIEYIEEQKREADTVDERLRGDQRLESDELKAISKEYTNQKDSVLWSGLKIPEEDCNKHFAIIGKSGSGKSMTIRLLMQSVLPSIVPGSGRRAIVYDDKRNFLPAITAMPLHEDVPIYNLNPFDKRSVAWDISKDLSHISEASTFADLLIGSTQYKGDHPKFFDEHASLIVSGLLKAFMIEAPGRWTFRDVFVCLRDLRFLMGVLMSCDYTKADMGRFFGAEKTSWNTIQTIASHLSEYEFLASAWEDIDTKISLKDWMNEEAILVLANVESSSTALQAINQMLISKITQLLLDQTERRDQKTWFFLDEVQSMGKIEKLVPLLTRTRSKDGCCVLGFQDFQGFQSIYGYDTASVIIGQVSHLSILKVAQQGTAIWASNMFGQADRLLVTEGRSHSGQPSEYGDVEEKSFLDHFGEEEAPDTYTKTESIITSSVILDSEFMGLPEASRERGVHGFHRFPRFGSGKVIIDGESIAEELIVPDRESQEIEKRSNEKLMLSRWTREDVDRLGFINTDYFEMEWSEAIAESSKYNLADILEEKQVANAHKFDLLKD